MEALALRFEVSDHFLLIQSLQSTVQLRNCMTTDKLSTNHLNRIFLSKLPLSELELKMDLLHEGLKEAKNNNDVDAIHYLNKWLEEVQGAIEIKAKLED